MHPRNIRDMPSVFKFQSKKCHLTYKGLLDYDEYLAWITQEHGAPQYYSIVNEVGDENEDVICGDHNYSADGYEHTHVALIWPKKIQKQGVSLFDYKGVHPHCAVKSSMAWMELIFLKYHWGHKTKADGKKYYVKPFKDPEQKVPHSWSANIWEGIRECSTLMDAAEYTGIRVKSLTDLGTVRAQKRHREQEIDWDPNAFPVNVPPPEDWDPEMETLCIFGIPHCGKTSWAKNYFGTKYFKMTNIEAIVNAPEDCSGYIFDDCNMASKSTSYQQAVLDCRTDTNVRVLRKVHTKLQKPQILLHKCKELAFAFDNDANMVRVYVWDVDWPRIEKTDAKIMRENAKKLRVV
jgi:hypothetical protein